MSLSIHPLFVFDGPNKPPFKRNKRTGPNVASIPEFLAKQLLKQFGFPFHIAPGEAEAECALLQREGIVDAVLSEDVDTLMFGSGLTFRNWSPEVSKTQSPTHVNVYNAVKTKTGSGLDREGMILVALMSGGDYIPEGIPGAGPKVACEAARAGFGRDMCKIAKGDGFGFGVWRERLQYELRTNESKFFKRRHGALDIPDDFPNIEALGYYTNPAISSKAQLDKLRDKLKWDHDIDFAELRTFTAEAFDWTKLGGAKKFIRNLAPALLIRSLRLRAEATNITEENAESVEEESRLITAFHGKRNHASTDGMTEIRVSFRPLDIVPLDLALEELDDDAPGVDSEDEGVHMLQEGDAPSGTPASPTKKRSPPNYDPSQHERLWIAESIIEVGVPIKVKEWEDSLKDAKKYLELKRAAKAVGKGKSKAKKRAADGGIPKGAINQFTRITKPGHPSVSESVKLSSAGTISESEHKTLPGLVRPSDFQIPPVPVASSRFEDSPACEVVDLLSSSPPTEITLKDTLPPFHPGPDALRDSLPSTVTRRQRRSPLKRSTTDSVAICATDNGVRPTKPLQDRSDWLLNRSPLPSPSSAWPSKRSKHGEIDFMDLTNKTPSKSVTRKSFSAQSSPARQGAITQYFSPSKVRHKNMSEEIPPLEFPKMSKAVKSIVDASAVGGSHQVKKKGIIRIRESLPGTFAIEEVDLTETTRVLTKKRDGNRDFRVSEVSFVDLLDS